MLRWGILGTSFISETMAQAILDDPGSKIQAVASRRIETVEAFTGKYPAAQQYTDYHLLLNDPDVDIVYVGLPNHLHHQLIVESLAANKHVLSEKSLSIDMPKSNQIREAVAASDRFFIEGLMYLHHPLMEKLIELMNENRLGTIQAVSAHYQADIAQFVNPAGKGALYNLGCYPVSLVHLVLQTAFGRDIWTDVKLAGHGTRSTGDGNICEAVLSMRLSNGVLATVHTAETYGMFSDFVIVGDKGSLRFDTNPWLPTASNQMTFTPFEGTEEQVNVTAEGDAFYYQVRKIREAIETGQKALERPAPSIQDSVEIMQILTRWEADCGTD